MGYQYYREFYGYIVGLKIRKQIGKKYIYRIRNGKQEKYLYYKPYDPKDPGVVENRGKLRNAVRSWQTLSNEEKEKYRKLEPFKRTMSGYNYYISLYMKLY